MDTTDLLDKVEQELKEMKQQMQKILNFPERVHQLRDTVLPRLQERCNAEEENMCARQEELTKDWEQLENIRKDMKEFEGKLKDIQLTKDWEQL
jgi:Asp-tRNA(Asn)/Glu-tRNA(Gln) amidotransferase C subunit